MKSFEHVSEQPQNSGVEKTKKKPRLAHAVMLTALLSLGKETLASDSNNQIETPKRNVEMTDVERAQEVFAEITAKLKKVNTWRFDELNTQLKLYEDNEKLLGRLPPDQKAEFQHQWAFTKYHQTIQRYDLKFKERLYTGLNLRPEQVETELEGLLKVYDMVIEARDYFRKTNIKRSGWTENASVDLADDLHYLIIDISAGLPRAIEAKKQLCDKIKHELARLSHDNTQWSLTFSETWSNGPHAPNWFIDLEMSQGPERTTSIPLYVEYDPNLGRAVVFGLSKSPSPELKKFIEKLNQSN